MSLYHNILGKKSLKPFNRILSLVLAGLLLAAVTIPNTTKSVSADAQAATVLPATVSADPLPTVQINGIVWDSVTVGNRVFVTGAFTKARPAGSPAGQNETARSNLLAFDITTGALDQSFNHSLNDEGRAITASPDGKRLYVGGKFTQVDGQNRYRIVAFDLTNNQLVPNFNQGTTSMITSVAATNTAVYVGGNFVSTVNGVTHNRLMAIRSTGQVIDSWNPSTNNQVSAMVMSSDNQRLIVGGNFSQLNGQKYHSLAAVNATSGAAVPWSSQSDTFPIRVDIAGAGITSLSTDGQQIYLTSYNFHARNDPGGFEGRAAINQTNGNLIWMNDCHGDSYDAVPLNGVLYSVGHAHDCQPAGAFPQSSDGAHHFALAETTYRTGTNGAATGDYWSFAGQPRSSLLTWYPNFVTGSISGQAGWTTTGNSDYLVIGGEFPSVDGVAQQGLVRYAVRSKAPNKFGPKYYSAGTGVKAEKAGSDGRAVVSWNTTWDRDDARLTYTLYRDGNPTPIATASRVSKFWQLPTMRYFDKGLQPGSSHSYKVVVSDPYGNTTNAYTQAATGCHVSRGSVNTMCQNENLTSGQAIFSQNAKYSLRMMPSGDLQLAKTDGTILWHTNTVGREQSQLSFQTDGNAVVYPVRGGVSWTAATANRNGSYMTLRDDGNLVIYNTSNQAIWATNTAQAN